VTFPRVQGGIVAAGLVLLVMNSEAQESETMAPEPAHGEILHGRIEPPSSGCPVLDIAGSLCIVGVPDPASPPPSCGLAPLSPVSVEPGHATIYAKDGEHWVRQADLAPTGSRDIRGFGYAVAIDKAIAVVTTHSWLGRDDWVREGHVFQRAESGSWRQVLAARGGRPDFADLRNC
jgi:hypothetical protein